MPSSFSDDILSAYLDDELPSEERAAVAAWLESSPEARRTLAGLRRLRVCFEELPRAELSCEFAAEVLLQAERQMLLPSAAAIAVSPRGWRRWLLPALATASAAAVALMLAVQTERGGAQRAQDRPLAARLESARESQNLADDKRVSTPADVAQPGEGAAIDAADMAETVAAGMPAAARSTELDSEADELVEAIRAAGDAGQVPVVRLYVVDGHADLRFVQWVLEKNQAESTATDSPELSRSPPEVAASAAAGGGKDAGVATKNSAPTPRQGLLVITSPGQLGDVLQALLHDKGRVIGVRVDTPIDVARLDEPARRVVEEEELIAAADKAAGQVAALSKSRALANAPAGRDAKSFAAGGAAGRSRATSTQDFRQERKRSAAAAADHEVPATREGEVPGRLKQLVVAMPESTTSGLTRTGTEPQAYSAKEKGAEAAAGASAKVAEAAHEAGEPLVPSLVRVIILVEPQSAAEKRPQSPAKPSEGGSRQRFGRSRLG